MHANVGSEFSEIDVTQPKHQTGRLNAAALVALLRRHARRGRDVRVGGRVDHDALAITVEGAEGLSEIERAVRELGSRDPSSMTPLVEEAALEGLKFSQCLPKELALATLASRLRDVPAIREVASQPLRVVSGA